MFGAFTLCSVSTHILKSHNAIVIKTKKLCRCDFSNIASKCMYFISLFLHLCFFSVSSYDFKIEPETKNMFYALL